MSEKEIDVKIFISGHKPCFEVRSDIFVPARQKEIIRALEQGTEEDRFMAARANEYCELLTQYWAWKYQKADYYGFGHYRRYFDFSDEKFRSRKPAIKKKYLHAGTARECGFYDSARIRRIVSRCGVVASVPFNYYVKSVRWQFETSGTLHVEDLDTVVDIIRTDYPAYYKAAKKYLGGHYMYTCNMFVMERGIFEEYSAWLFGILRKFYERRDMRALGYSREAMRTPGHLGERLFGVYVTWLSQQKKCRIGRRSIITFEDTEPSLGSFPAFDVKGMPVVMAADFQSVPRAAAALRSLALSAAESDHYSVLLLCSGVPVCDREKLRDAAEEGGHISLRFADVERLADEYGLSALPAAAREAFALYALPLLCGQTERAVYLNNSCIVRACIAELYSLPLGENRIAAVPDAFAEGACNGYSARLRDRFRELGAVTPIAETGVTVLHFSALRDAYSLKDLAALAAEWGEDALAAAAFRLCGGKILPLSAEWNYIPEEDGSDRAFAVSLAPEQIFTARAAAERRAKIVQFAGSEKPWQDVWSRHADIFWKVCRTTPYGEALLLQGAKPRRLEKGSGNVVISWISYKLFPRGSRRRNALKKLFGKRR